MDIIQTKEELAEASNIFAAAFTNYPLYTYLFPNSQTRLKLLPILFKCSAAYASEYALHISKDGRMQAVMLLDSPNKKNISFRELIALLYKYGHKFPLKRSIRMLKIFREYMAAQPAGSFYYIQTIAVSPENQGKGLGKNCIAFAREKAGMQPIFLETNSPANVNYYTQAGFQLHRQFKCNKGKGPDTWSFYEANKATSKVETSLLGS